jgi:beta-phosphoglucomutase
MLQAIIFDFNGVICNDEPLHFAALKRVLHEEEIEISEQDYVTHFLGKDDRACFTQALYSHRPGLDKETLKELIYRKSDYYLELVAEDLQIFPGVEAFIQEAHSSCQLAIASGALRREIQFVLDRSHLEHYFACVVSSEDVAQGKPDPEIFNTTLSTLNRSRNHSIQISPSECLVIEDSKPGVTAALAAGMRCLAVTNSFSHQELSSAHEVLPGLVLSPSSIRKLIQRW